MTMIVRQGSGSRSRRCLSVPNSASMCSVAGEAVQRMKEDPTVEEKALLREEFVSQMYQHFLDGKDRDFNYRSVPTTAARWLLQPTLDETESFAS